MMKGGCVPAGILRMDTGATAETCDMARRMSAEGWKKILTIPAPGSDRLSTCSILSTVVVNMRWNGVIMRPDTSEACRPPYWKTMATIGMLMAGKISTGMLKAASGPAIRISNAMTIKVRGRSRATRTIQVMGWAFSNFQESSTTFSTRFLRQARLKAPRTLPTIVGKGFHHHVQNGRNMSQSSFDFKYLAYYMPLYLLYTL